MTDKTYIDGTPTEDYGKPWSKSFYPEFQQIENGCKVSVPLFTNLELKKLDYNIQTHYNEVIEQISKTVSRDREIIILKKVIQKQDTEINKLKKINDLMSRAILNYDDQLVINQYRDKEHVKEIFTEYAMKEDK